MSSNFSIINRKSDKHLLDAILSASTNCGFLRKLFHVASDGLEISVVLSFSDNISWIPAKEAKHSNTEKIDDFRKVQWQNYGKLAKVSLNPFSSKK